MRRPDRTPKRASAGATTGTASKQSLGQLVTAVKRPARVAKKPAATKKVAAAKKTAAPKKTGKKR